MMPQLLCDDQDLKRFLEGDLSPAEESTWLEHIESCRECQTRLEGLAASRDWWSQAKSFLTESDPTGPGLPGDGPMARQMPFSAASGGAHPIDDPEESAPEPLSLEFLGPTDDPESLGRIGIYEVTGVIGRGGSGIVFKAFDPTLDRNVAIKVLSPHLAASGAARKRFAREAQAAAAVVHEHVIPIFAVASHQNLPYIVMQYFPGKSLQQRLDRDGPLELKEILRIGLQTARGLAAAHAQGLIHRDVKPANILLGDGIERVSLSDFGLARALDDARLTRTGWLAGTPEYMSPEQAKGQALDARSDLFSLGSVLYALCTGRVPFHAETSYGTLRKVTDEEPTPIRQINPDIPEWLCRLIGQLMAKTPAERLGSASEVADLLETCLAHVQQPDSTSLPTALHPKPQTARSSHSGGKRTLVATLLGFLGFLLAGVFLWHSTSPPDIAGWWTGEDWGKVQLKHLGSGEYEGTYSDTFGKDPGQIQLKWSRIERRFNGTWREGEDRFGELSLRLVKEEIRGALTTDARSKINPATPRLADLVWVKLSDQGPGIHGTLGKQAPQSSMTRLESFQGEWVPLRVIGEDGAELAREKIASRVWTIKGTNLIVEGEEIRTFPLTVVETGPPVRIEFTAPVSLPTQARKPSLKTTEISSLWERRTTPEGERLIIVVGQDGKKPTQVKPTTGFVFYELRRLEKPSDGPPPAIPAAKDEVAENPILKNLPYLNQLFRDERRESGAKKAGADKFPQFSQPKQGPDGPRETGEKKQMDPGPLTEPKPVAIGPETGFQATAKEAILKRLQGRWARTKVYGTDGKPFGNSSMGRLQMWTISRDTLHNGDLPQNQLTRLEILDSSFPCKIVMVDQYRSNTLAGLHSVKENKNTSLWNIENGKLKILFFDKEKTFQKVEPTVGCTYYELVLIGDESPSPHTDQVPSEKPNEKQISARREDSLWMPPAGSPPDSGPCLVLHPTNRGAKAPLVQPLWRDLPPVSKTAVFGNADRPFEITWTFKKLVLLNPSPDAECYEFHKRYFPLPGIPTPEPQTKEVTFIGMPIEIFRDDRYTMVLMPNPGETKPKDPPADPQLFEAMLKKIGSMPAASMVAKGIPTVDYQLPLREVFQVKGQRTRKQQFHREQLLLTQVCDFHTKKSLLLNVPEKFANQLDYQPLSPQEYRHVEKFENPLNLIEKSLRGTQPDFVGSQPIDGNACQVFQVQLREEGYELLCGPWMVWIDPKSQLPVLIRGATQSGVLEYSLFQWNPTLEDAIFSQEVPKGFAIQKFWSDPVDQVRRVQGETIQWKYLKQTVDPKKEIPVNPPPASIPPTQANRDPRNEIPRSENAHLVLYRKKPDGVERFVQKLPRHPFGFDQPRITEEVVVPGARFTVTWKWGNRLPLVPGPDAELLDVQILKSGDPVSKTLTKQVYLVGHSVTLHEDDNFKLVLEPTSGSLSATKMVSETPELIAMLEKIKTNDSVSWENQGVGLFREADLIFCCQKKGLLRCDEYRDQKWLRSQVLNFPQSKILSVDSDPSVPRGEGTLDATSLHLQNLFVQFADMASDRAILLGQETVEGKPCNLYRIQSDAPYQKTYQDRYLWVDPATHLPTAIRLAAKEAPAVFTYRQFLWSLPLGDDHFHLETTKEKRPAPPGKPKTEVGSPTSKTETKDPQSTPKAPDKKTSTKP